MTSDILALTVWWDRCNNLLTGFSDASLFQLQYILSISARPFFPKPHFITSCDPRIYDNSLLNPNTVQIIKSHFLPNKTFLCPCGKAAPFTILPVYCINPSEVALVLTGPHLPRPLFLSLGIPPLFSHKQTQPLHEIFSSLRNPYLLNTRHCEWNSLHVK